MPDRDFLQEAAEPRQVVFGRVGRIAVDVGDLALLLAKILFPEVTQAAAAPTRGQHRRLYFFRNLLALGVHREPPKKGSVSCRQSYESEGTRRRRAPSWRRNPI